MPLPILQANAEPTNEDLIRFFHRTELHWTQHLAEETALDAGTAFANPALPQLAAANNLRDAVLPEGLSPVQTVEMVRSHYAEQKLRCAFWVMNPSAPADRTGPLQEHLLSAGYVARGTDILYLQQMPRTPIREAGGLKIIPARASFRHVRLLAAEAAGETGASPDGVAEQWMLHLDDPHWDSVLALRDATAVGTVGVLAVGDIGRIDNLYVSPSGRRRGVGRTLMCRALEICLRSIFKHVFVPVDPANAAGIALCGQFGFRRIGKMIAYDAP